MVGDRAQGGGRGSGIGLLFRVHTDFYAELYFGDMSRRVFNVDNPPHGLVWIKQAPDDCSGAIEFAYERCRHEALGANCAQAEGRLQ